MANNPYVNKVEYGGNTLIDITDATASESDVLPGKIFYKASGERTVGALANATQNADGLMSSEDKTKLDGIDQGATATIKTYATLSDLGLSGSTASLSDIYSAMAVPSIALLQGNVINSTDMPDGTTLGYVKIEKSTNARSRIFYYGKLDAASDCYMALTSGNVPTGTWIQQFIDGTYGNSANPITDLADLPLYSCGNVTLAASLSPTGSSISGSYIKAGTSNRYNVIFVHVSNSATVSVYIAKVYNNTLIGWSEVVTDKSASVDVSSNLTAGQSGTTVSDAFLKRTGNTVVLACRINNSSTSSAKTIASYQTLVKFPKSIGLPSVNVSANGFVSGTDGGYKDVYVSKDPISGDTSNGRVTFADSLTIPAGGFIKINATWVI